jgi:hypothetical protein
MYLLDTNLFLEILLGQERAEERQRFLQQAPREQLLVSDFSLYSIGIHAFRRGIPDAFVCMVQDIIIEGGVRLVALSAEDMRQVADVSLRYRLDFDDAYQCVVAQREAAQIVSFDSDFDRTEIGRTTPASILSGSL